MSQYDPRILEGLQAIREKHLKAKSCGVGGVNYLTNPNLEQESVEVDIVNLVVSTSILLSSVDNRTNQPCSGHITYLDSCEIIAKGACVTCDTSGQLDDFKIPFELKKFMAEWQIGEDFLECNRLGSAQQTRDLLTAIFLTQIRNNMELAAIYGDESLPVGKGQTPWNNLMGINDGWLKQACQCTPECQIIDAEGMGPSPCLFQEMMLRVPHEYSANLANYRILSGVRLRAWYAKYRTERGTEMADNVLSTGNPGDIWGMDFMTLPAWREDLAYAGAAKGVTHVLFTPLNNLLHLSGRTFEVEQERNIKCDATDYTAYWKTDQMIRNPRETVLIKNLNLCGMPYESCETKSCDTCRPDVNNPCE